GHRKGDILAPNLSVTPGTDMKGPTAVIKSHCSVDFSKLPCGTALDLKVLPSSARGENGIAALVAIMRAFVSLGGIFMQIDVVDTELLRDAQAHPEKYPNLAVRISGWSARFATLSNEWQEMIIKRSEHKL
ncbi:MAG: glycine radical domain-containing protein, partial [Desulfuromonadales bacterium]